MTASFATKVAGVLDAAAMERLVAIAHEPQRFAADPSVRLVRATGRKSLFVVTLPGRDAFVKVYRAREGLGRIKEALRASAGFQIWGIAERLLRAGIEAPTPLAAGERRLFGRRLEWTFFACEYLRNVTSLDTLTRAAPSWDEARRTAFADRVGSEFGRLWSTGFVQPDLKPTNFLVRGEASSAFTVLPVDLRQCRVGGPLAALARRGTATQLRERVMEGWPEATKQVFFAAFDRDARPR